MKAKVKCKIVLADDHVLLRDALAGLINSFEECTVIGAAGNGEEVMEIIANGNMPNVVLLDLNMPKLDGYDTAALLQQKYPDIKLLVLTMFDSEIALIRLLKIGVRGFMKKDIHPYDLKEALLSVAEDGYYYSNNATGKLASFFQKSHRNHASIEKGMLTEKEIEFLKFASTEMTYKEIAMKMGLTPRAIDSLRDGLFEKLDVKSRVGLAIYSVKNGIVNF